MQLIGWHGDLPRPHEDRVHPHILVHPGRLCTSDVRPGVPGGLHTLTWRICLHMIEGRSGQAMFP